MMVRIMAEAIRTKSCRLPGRRWPDGAAEHAADLFIATEDAKDLSYAMEAADDYLEAVAA